MRATSSSLGEKQLKAIFSGYDLGEVSAFRPASSGKKFSNYYISTSAEKKKIREAQAFPDTQEFVLTLLEQNCQLSPTLQPLLTNCADAGLPVPRLYPDKAGTFQGSFKNQPVIVCSRLRGRPVFNPTIAQCASIGRFLARFHMANVHLEAEPQPITADFLEQQANRVHAYIPPADARLLMDSISDVCSMLGRTDVQNLPHGVIHGALFRNNVLFNERGLSGALGFHHAGYGFWLFDLAIAVNDWCTLGSGEPNKNKTLALLGAYHQIRPLGKQECWFFSLFMLFAVVSIWLNCLDGTFCPQSIASIPLKKSGELRKILMSHTTHPFHLDERLLEKS